MRVKSAQKRDRYRLNHCSVCIMRKRSHTHTDTHRARSEKGKNSHAVCKSNVIVLSEYGIIHMNPWKSSASIVCVCVCVILLGSGTLSEPRHYSTADKRKFRWDIEMKFFFYLFYWIESDDDGEIFLTFTIGYCLSSMLFVAYAQTHKRTGYLYMWICLSHNDFFFWLQFSSDELQRDAFCIVIHSDKKDFIYFTVLLQLTKKRELKIFRVLFGFNLGKREIRSTILCVWLAF